MVPHPIRVGTTGTPVISASATSSSAASALTTPPPATISGCSDAAIMVSAFSACLRVAAGLLTGIGS